MAEPGLLFRLPLGIVEGTGRAVLEYRISPPAKNNSTSAVTVGWDRSIGLASLIRRRAPKTLGTDPLCKDERETETRAAAGLARVGRTSRSRDTQNKGQGRYRGSHVGAARL